MKTKIPTREQVRALLEKQGIDWNAADTVGYPGHYMGRMWMDGKFLRLRRGEDCFETVIDMSKDEHVLLATSLGTVKQRTLQAQEMQEDQRKRKLSLASVISYVEDLADRCDTAGVKITVTIER